MITRISGKYEDVNNILAVGEMIVIDGIEYFVEEISTYHSESEHIHYADYTIKPVALLEKQITQLREL